MRILLLVPILLLLAGCLSLDGLVSTGASTAGAVAGTALISPTAGAVLGISAGLAGDALVETASSNPENYAGADGELNFWEMLAFMWANFTQHIITVGIVGGILWILTGYLGMRMKRPEEKAVEKILFEKLK